MSRLSKLGLVLGGYAVAVVVAYAAVYVNSLLTPADPAQASAGMQAFGDFILFVGVFGLLAVIPTGLGLYFLITGRETS